MPKLEKDDGLSALEALRNALYKFKTQAYLLTCILLWNIRGLQANREELNILLSNFNPILASLQETFLKPDKTTTFKNYSFYNLPGEESNGTIHGGIMAILPYQITMQFHTVISNLTLACRLSQSEPHAKLSPYVPSIYLHHPNLTAVILIISLPNCFPHSTAWRL